MTRTTTALLALTLCVGSAGAQSLTDTVMYEVNLRAFSAAGDLDGVTARLDELQALGVNTIWLMPIHPVGQINKVQPLGSPYSVQNYTAIGGEYGNQQDLQELVDGAHARGMRVMLDWVANHTAFDHAWISAHPDWYSQDGQGNIISPPGTGWLDVADLNYNNSAMRAAMIGEMQYWVTNVGVDGFRCDAADFVPYSFWAQAVPAVRAASATPLLMLAEGGRTDHYTAGFDMIFGWDFNNALRYVFADGQPATLIAQAAAAADADSPAGKGDLRFTTNHDQTAFDGPPTVVLGGLDASKAAFAAELAYGSVPLIYSGQEVGSIDNTSIFSNDPIDWNSGQATRDWYTWILGVRAEQPALREGTVSDSSSPDVVFVRRDLNGQSVLALINTRNATKSAFVPTAWRGYWFNLETELEEPLGLNRQLQPYQVLLLGSDLPATCVADVTTTNTNPFDPDFGVPDGSVDGADLSYYIEQWLGQNASVADVTTINTNPGDANYGQPDGSVDGADLSFFVEAWLNACA